MLYRISRLLIDGLGNHILVLLRKYGTETWPEDESYFLRHATNDRREYYFYIKRIDHPEYKLYAFGQLVSETQPPTIQWPGPSTWYWDSDPLEEGDIIELLGVGPGAPIGLETDKLDTPFGTIYTTKSNDAML